MLINLRCVVESMKLFKTEEENSAVRERAAIRGGKIKTRAVFFLLPSDAYAKEVFKAQKKVEGWKPLSLQIKPPKNDCFSKKIVGG